jgi:hypothetical protein
MIRQTQFLFLNRSVCILLCFFCCSCFADLNHTSLSALRRTFFEQSTERPDAPRSRGPQLDTTTSGHHQPSPATENMPGHTAYHLLPLSPGVIFRRLLTFWAPGRRMAGVSFSVFRLQAGHRRQAPRNLPAVQRWGALRHHWLCCLACG